MRDPISGDGERYRIKNYSYPRFRSGAISGQLPETPAEALYTLRNNLQYIKAENPNYVATVPQMWAAIDVVAAAVKAKGGDAERLAELEQENAKLLGLLARCRDEILELREQPPERVQIGGEECKRIFTEAVLAAYQITPSDVHLERGAACLFEVLNKKEGG